ncbi:MAG: T9SS C-terminal target domain-containing protein, partial [Bacteroidetes bacterium]
VNGNAVTNLNGDEVGDRSAGSWTLKAENQAFEPGQTISLQLQANDEESVAGYQLALEYDAQSLILNDIKVLDEGSSENFAFNEVRPGLILMNWYDNGAEALKSVLPRIEFEALAAGQLSTSVRIVDDFLSAEAYPRVSATGDLEVKAINLEFTPGSSETLTLTSLRNIPNPFTGATRLQLTTQTNGLVRLYITDLDGKLVWSFEEHLEKGFHELLLTDDDLPGQGVYICRMLTESGHETIKLVKVSQP